MPYKRPIESAAPGGVPVGKATTCQLASKFPEVWAFISDVTWEDGSEREPGSILLCIGDGLVKMWLNDRSNSRLAWISADTLSGVFKLANEGLGASTLPWRSQPDKGKRK